MIFLALAIKSLRNRWFTSVLTITSIALSVTLLLSVEKARESAEKGFTETIAQTDLIVGGRTGSISMVLYSLFNMGMPSNNISWQSYEHFKNHPAVKWTIPYSLGDGHRGFRVIGTTLDYFKYYRYRDHQEIEFANGHSFTRLQDVVIGSAVARELGYKIGQSVVIAHGVTREQGVLFHDRTPFEVVGVLKPTGTPIDRSVFMSLESLVAIHLDFQAGAGKKERTWQDIQPSDLKISSITGFFLRTNSRIETLGLQREINEYNEEALSAVIPGVALGELWKNLSYIEVILKGISSLVVLVGLVSMLIALLTSLNERRREMSILRALGARSTHIIGLLVFESMVLTSAGIFLGVMLSFFARMLLAPWLQSEFGFTLSGSLFTAWAGSYLALIFIAGVCVGVLPATLAMRRALKDGLSVKV